MDKQLIDVFEKKYFSKNQLRKRIYDKDELENVWEIINTNRKKECVELDINRKLKIWCNNTEDIRESITYINDIENSDLINYLAFNKVMVSQFWDYKEDTNSKNEKLDIINIEQVYLAKCSEKSCSEIYRNNNKIRLNDIFNHEFYMIENCEVTKNLLIDFIEFIEAEKSLNIIVKASILHFYIGYLNPFMESNLYMAEYITNTYLINNGYKIISKCNQLTLIKEDTRAYYTALENSIVNDGDITYFIKYYTRILNSAIKEFTKEVSVKYGKKIIKQLLEKNNVELEERQIKFINSMIILTNNKINIDEYKKKAKISYETARSDLNGLVALGFFKISKVGKKYEYYFNDIATIIENINEINGI